MKSTEIALVLAYLTDAYPRSAFEERTARLWRAELENTFAPDGAGMEAARRCARRLRYCPSLAEYLGELRDVRAEHRRRAPQALPSARDDCGPLSDPANWAAFVHGSRAEAARLGKAAPKFPDEAPAGVSMTQILAEMFRPEPVAAQTPSAPTPLPEDDEEFLL